MRQQTSQQRPSHQLVYIHQGGRSGVDTGSMLGVARGATWRQGAGAADRAVGVLYLGAAAAARSCC